MSKGSSFKEILSLLLQAGFGYSGGAVDKTDYNDTSINTCFLARVAAKREAFEECGLTVSEDTLYHFCKWTTPVEEKNGFVHGFLLAL